VTPYSLLSVCKLEVLYAVLELQKSHNSDSVQLIRYGTDSSLVDAWKWRDFVQWNL